MKRLIGLMAAVGLLLTLALPVAATHKADHESGGEDGKVTLCHATNSETNPYVVIQVDASGDFSGHKTGEDFHINAKTGLQDFLLEGSGVAVCADILLVPVTPLAPAVSAATCLAPGMLTLTAVAGIAYTITPAYTAGVSSGDFTVTAAAEAGFRLAPGATTTFNVTVPAQLNCVAAAAPSVSAGTCVAPGALTLNAVTGVTYSVSPAYSAGGTGTFTVTAAAASGYTLTGQNVFVVNVPAQLVCSSGTQGSTGGPAAPPAPPVRSGTQASTGVPNTATSADTGLAAAAALGALMLLSAGVFVSATMGSGRRRK